MSNTTRQYRDMTANALPAKINQLKQELFACQDNVFSGQEKNHAKIKLLQREIARAKTVLAEKINH